MPSLEAALCKRRDAGGRAFVPYVTGGFPGVDPSLLRGLQDCGADAIEVGIPFSDPVMDGGVIQEASRIALVSGARLSAILDMIAEASLEVPVVIMTYVNPIYVHGFQEFLAEAERAGIAGVIVPDLPFDEAEEWISACSSHDMAAVQLAAPGTGSERLARIAQAARGFVYCVGTYGVTGARDSISGTAEELVERLRPLTDLPLLVGVGVGTPEQAAEVGAFADGAIVGSALMEQMLGGGADRLLTLAGDFRRALPTE